MKKDDVQIGKTYMAKLSKSVIPVRIDTENPKGGWNVTSMTTGRTQRIASGEQLQRECTEADLAGFTREVAKKPKRQATRAPQAAPDAKPEAQTAKDAKAAPDATRAKQGDKAPKAKAKTKMSGLDAAAKILSESKEPMGVKEIIEVAFAKKYWHSDAKTPHATIYAAMIREIAIKKKDARFRKVGRGKFAIRQPE